MRNLLDELNIPNFACPHCGAAFTSERVANMHIAGHDHDGVLAAMARLQNLLTRTAAKYQALQTKRTVNS